MKAKRSIRLLALLLVAAVLSTCALGAPAQIAYDDLEAQPIDLAALRQSAQRAQTLAQSVDNAAQVQQCVVELYDALTDAATNYTLAMIAYYQDTVTPSVAAEFTAAGDTYTALTRLIAQTLRALMQTPCAQAVREIVSAEDIDAALSGSVDTDAALTEITDRYTAAYNDALGAEHTSYDALIEDVGGLYLRMIAELKAAAGGGEAAVARFYENYGRSGDYASYEPLRKAVREEIAPVYLRLLLIMEVPEGGPEGGAQTLQTVASVAEAHIPGVTDALEYLLTYGYYDVEAGEAKANAGFTTYLYRYEAPYLFLPTNGGADGVSSISHELGHYWNSYEFGPGVDVDAAEVHSQGLELLYTLYYDEIFGDTASDAAQYTLTNVLSAVVLGCVMDEFQYRAFTQTPGTAQELAALYRQILCEYGMGALADYSLGYYWLWVNHSFSQPMYYLSYAISALPALELWSNAQDDEALAWQQYDTFMERSNDEDFSAALRAAGLSQPGDAEAASEIADNAAQVARTGSGWLYTDVSGCWGATEIQWFGIQGATDGYADGTYRPNGTLTRAHVAQVLVNLAGGVEEDLSGVYVAEDVPADYWAHDAIATVVAAGLMDCDEDGLFHPRDAIERQEFARVVDAILRASGVTAEGTVHYTDEAQIDPECEAAIGTLAALDIMHGDASGAFHPEASLTRQQMAVIFFRTASCLALAG